MSGEIPAELGSLSNLGSLDLSFTELSGEIPPELGSLSNLTQLYLDGSRYLSWVRAKQPGKTSLNLDYLSALAACPSAEAPRPQPGTDGISSRRRSRRVLAMAHGAAEQRGISLSLRRPPG